MAKKTVTATVGGKTSNKWVSLTGYQAVELGHWALASWLADVPDFHAALAAGVDVTCGVADGDGTHNFPVAQCVDLAGVARDARANQCIWRKGYRLHLTIGAHVKRISSEEDRGDKRSV